MQVTFRVGGFLYHERIRTIHFCTAIKIPDMLPMAIDIASLIGCLGKTLSLRREWKLPDVSRSELVLHSSNITVTHVTHRI